ncbi:TonB family protein [Pseudoalteromonas sp. G4]|uniref:TonB family protein n=1 Tax=Pseudoalteromonas sp. G4 TaxID=2992761 RepID=UPI00237E1E4B|nr:TonB family protein [Pseudoalteromonas sp. G4]MDE3271885.1 TonB family protein [Pseudoalteromonas sp. G4]
MSSALIATVLLASINTPDYEVSACDKSKFSVNHAVAAKWPLIEDHLRLDSGYVKIEAIVNSAGFVTSQKIVDTKPRRVFDRSAKKAMKQWSFSESSKEERCFNVVFKFKLVR